MKFINPVGKKVELTEEEKKTIKDCIDIVGEIYLEMTMSNYENMVIKDEDSYYMDISRLDTATEILEDLQNVIEIF